MKTNSAIIIVLLIIIMVLQIVVLSIFVSSLREQQNGVQLGGITEPIVDLSERLERTELVLTLSGNDALGVFLVGTNGMTLYTFANDEPGKSNCHDVCATNWRPLSVSEGKEPLVSNGGAAGELGVIERADDIRQVTYNDKPLYFFSGDEALDVADGHGLDDVWFVATP